MYYYIFDPPQGPKEYERTHQIKELVASLGIAGEMSTPTPGRTVEDLVKAALSKRYSTIIAVGGVPLINRTARALLGADVVFGIIPTVEHPDIAQLIGVSDWKLAAEHLKRRRFQSVRLGSLGEEQSFLTPAVVEVPAAQVFEISTKTFSLSGHGGKVVISPPRQEEGEEEHGRLSIDVLPQAAPKKGLLSGLFKSAPTVPQQSHLELEQFELVTETPQEILIAGTSVASTPVRCGTHPTPLKLIVARGGSAAT